MNKRFGYGAFAITLGTATFNGETLSIDALFENLAPNDFQIDPSHLTVVSAGNSYGWSGDPVPKVAGNAKASGTLVFSIFGPFDLENAMLVVGRGEQNQAVVPLAGRGTARLLEPHAEDITGEATAGTLTVKIVDGLVAAGNFQFNDQATKDKVVVHLELEAGTTEQYGENFIGNHLVLKVPNGEQATPIGGSNEVLTAGGTTAGMFADFEVPDARHRQLRVGRASADRHCGDPFHLVVASTCRTSRAQRATTPGTWVVGLPAEEKYVSHSSDVSSRPAMTARLCRPGRCVEIPQRRALRTGENQCPAVGREIADTEEPGWVARERVADTRALFDVDEIVVDVYVLQRDEFPVGAPPHRRDQARGDRHRTPDLVERGRFVERQGAVGAADSQECTVETERGSLGERSRDRERVAASDARRRRSDNARRRRRHS